MSDKQSEMDQQLLIWIIWGAFLMALLAYVGIGATVLSEGEGSDVSMMFNALAAVSIATFGGTFYVKKILGSKFAGVMIIWAMAESIAIFGFILTFVSSDPIYVYGFTPIAVIAHLIHNPTTFDTSSFDKPEENA